MARGQKTGGRRPGSKNKRTLELEARVEAMLEGIDASQMLPVDFLLYLMRDSKLEIGLRFEAARAAAPFLHPRLAQVEHSGPGRGPIQTEGKHEVSDIEAVRLIGRLLTRTAAATESSSEPPTG